MPTVVALRRARGAPRYTARRLPLSALLVVALLMSVTACAIRSAPRHEPAAVATPAAPTIAPAPVLPAAPVNRPIVVPMPPAAGEPAAPAEADQDAAESDDSGVADRAAPDAAALASRTTLAHATVTEPAGMVRAKEPLTFGVPFAIGALPDVATLRCWRASGAKLPIQARALNRWRDGSVRWALVDTQLSLAAHDSVRIELGLAPDINPSPLKWAMLPDPQAGADANAARVPLVSDGKVAWQVLHVATPAPAAPPAPAAAPRGGRKAAAAPAPAPEPEPAAATDATDATDAPALGDSILGLNAVLTDRFEKRYVAAVDVTSVKLLETGPLRMTYRLTGHHRALEPSKELPAFHDFSVVVSLIANCSLARVEWTLENGSLLEPTGPLAFHSYELLAATGLPAAATPDAEDAGLAADAADATDGADETAPTEATPKGKGGKAGDKPKAPACGVDVPGKASKGDVAFALRQDGPVPARFEYVLDGASLPANDGDLWGGVRCGKEGVWVHRADSAHNHPASLAHEPGGPLVIGLLPASADTEFWLDDATQKTFRLDVVRDSTGKGRETIAHAAQPARVLVDATDIANSLAWGDTGSFYVPDASEMREPVKLPKDPATGWVDWGEFSSKSTHETGSPRNKLSVYLEALQSGRADLYDLAQARAWHAMDLRPFHIEGFSADKYPMANLNEGTPHENEPARNRLGRSGMASRLKEWKTGIPARGHGYNGFDPEHMTLDDIYECWLLTGDWVAHDALVSAGEAMLTWKSVVKDGELHTARTTGWTLRALVQVFRATGDRRYLDAAADMVERADRMRGHGAVKYFHRNKKDPRHIADRESESAWMVAVGIRGLAAYWTETHDAKVPPMLRDLVDFIMASYRGNGFADDLPCDGPLTGGTVAAPLGVSQWIPGALADAAFITGNHEPVDAVYPYYRQMVEHPGYELRFGATSWHWWQSYLVSLQQRYGTVAVQSPSHFRMPERATH